MIFSALRSSDLSGRPTTVNESTFYPDFIFERLLNDIIHLIIAETRMHCYTPSINFKQFKRDCRSITP